MRTLRDASRADLPAIRALAATANDAPYDLAAVAEEKCFGNGVAGAPRARLCEEGGRIVGVIVTCGEFVRIMAVARHRRRNGIGTALFEDAQRGLPARSIVAAEAGNYFVPGILSTDFETLRFFTSRGYAPRAGTDNLETELAPFTELPDGAHRATQADRERVLAFIEKQFGRIWRFESTPAFDREQPTMFFTESNGRITGFAAHEANNRGLGFFGPTGVAASERGRGLGRILLRASLADLRQLGYERAVIPWTDALEFYGKSCGAKPTHHFVTLRRD